MAQKTRAALKAFFETGDKPTQQQFSDWLDSYVHKDDSISADKVAGLDDMLTELALKSDLTTHINDDVAHVTQAEKDTWDGKANTADVYTQLETNALLDDKADLESVYTQAEANVLLDNKANSDHLHNIYAKHSHIHIAEMKVSPTGADEEADSFRIRQDGVSTYFESTANGIDWVVLQVLER